MASNRAYDRMMDTSMDNTCVGRWVRTSRACAFTLVELLVVVAIIVILVGILVPSLRGVMERGYDATCKANMHSLGQMMHDKGPDGQRTIPNSAYWMSSVGAVGAQEILRCPMGHFEAVGGSGAVALDGITAITPPPTLIFNAVESDTTIHGFYEQQGYILPSDVTVDISQPGRYDNNYSATTTVIPAGTVVDCYYLWFDPVGSSSQTVNDRSVTMPGDILGVIVQSQALHNSDAALGMAGVEYPNPPADGAGARGYENNAEQVTLQEDMRTFYVHKWHSTFPGEQTRILTVPSETSGSYATNPLINPQTPRLGQIMLLEYSSSLVDLEDAGEHAAALQPRHFGKINVLFVNGSVKALPPEKLYVDSPLWKP